MAEHNNAQIMEGGIDDAFITPALKFDFIYNYMSSVDWKYFSKIPGNKQAAYRLKRIWLLLANGYVPEWHNNFITTKIGNTIVTAINRKVFSGAILYEADNAAKTETTEAQLQWFLKNYINSFESHYEDDLEKLSLFSLSSGAAAFVAKKKRNGNIYFDTYREDKYFPVFSGNKLVSVRLYSNAFIGTEPRSGQYILEDYRYYDRNGRACSKLRVFQNGADTNSIASGSSFLKYGDMPATVARAVKELCGNRLNKVSYLPFFGGRSLGVAILNNTYGSAYFDFPGFSDSCLAPAVEQIFEYDRTYTTMVNDIALGRGQVLLPDSMDLGLSAIKGDDTAAQIAALISQQNMLNTKVFRKYPSVNPEQEKPDKVQFEMRISEHMESLRGQRINIFNAVGVNPSSIDPTVSESGHQKTATEVMGDEQNLITFIQGKRKKIERINNWAIDLIMDYYFGVKDSPIKSKFTAGNLANTLIKSDIAIKEYAAGARSLESTVQRINEEDSIASINNEVQRIKDEREGRNFEGTEAFEL